MTGPRTRHFFRLQDSFLLLIHISGRVKIARDSLYKDLKWNSGRNKAASLTPLGQHGAVSGGSLILVPPQQPRRD